MRKILAFCFFPAFCPPSNGGVARLYYLYQALSRHFEITLLTSTHQNVEEEIVHHNPRFTERRIPKDEHFARRYMQLHEVSSGGDLSGPAIAASGCDPTLMHHAYLEEYESADVIIHDFPFTIDYDLFAAIDSKPRVYNAHNCETDLYRQLHSESKSNLICDLVAASEIKLLKAADLVLHCSDLDLARFRQIIPDSKFDSLHVPNGMVTQLLPASPKVTFGDELVSLRAVFIGSNHPPNSAAALFIATELAPALPFIKFEIIGSCLPEGNYVQNLHRHGVVDEQTKAQIVQSSNLALNPMSAGSGSNVKVLEYFSFGLTVLSTSFGMRGIDAKPGVEYIDASLADFENHLRQVAINPESVAAIGIAGLQLAQRQYTWTSIANPVVAKINSLIDVAHRTVKNNQVLVLNDYDSFAGTGGGCTRTKGLYEAVALWTPVVFVCFSENNELSVKKYNAEITVINIPKTNEHLSELITKNAVFHISVNDIVASKYCSLNPLMIAIYSICKKFAKSIVIEHCYMAPLPLLFGDRFIYSSQNHEVLLKTKLLYRHPSFIELIQQIEWVENAAIEASATTIAVSFDDAVNMSKGKSTAGPLLVVPNGATQPATGDAVDAASHHLRGRLGERNVVFLGSAHMPNVEAAKFITKHFSHQCPSVNFHIIGSVCSAISKPPANVTLWGVLDEVEKSAVMQSCDFALNPMSSGSGSNVKLADYVGNGLFVISTDFGHRGYADDVQEHLHVAQLNDFPDAIKSVINNANLFNEQARRARRELFTNRYSMQAVSQRFVQILKGLERKKKRILFVAYRYTNPSLGGAEVLLEHFMRALGNSNQFDIDVVTPEVSGIHNLSRFGETYTFDESLGVPVDIPNLRFARFAADTPNPADLAKLVTSSWRVQPAFEQQVDLQVREGYVESGLTWGWGHVEKSDDSPARWAFLECGIYAKSACEVALQGEAFKAVVIHVYCNEHLVAGPFAHDGSFSMRFFCPQGNVKITTTLGLPYVDPRPLGVHVTRLSFNQVEVDLEAPRLMDTALERLPASEIFNILHVSAKLTRFKSNISLTDSRGPWSDSMERYIADHASKYDLIITNNNVFRPAIVAINAASENNVPSILLPHAHLDDDFYHFPDALQCARNASLVLAVPHAACDFLREKGCQVKYSPGGCDVEEEFTVADQTAFQSVCNLKEPFVLVLGRKAGAKQYSKTIDAVEQLNKLGTKLKVVLIGPDDDGVPLTSPNAVYLGLQPRTVVRGALMSCFTLCHMSNSESFGIVLLEAWLAGKPVIANVHCAAFKDLAVHEENALLVDPIDLQSSIAMLLHDPVLGKRLAKKGREQCAQFAWKIVCGEFVDHCVSTIENHKLKGEYVQ